VSRWVACSGYAGLACPRLDAMRPPDLCPLSIGVRSVSNIYPCVLFPHADSLATSERLDPKVGFGRPSSVVRGARSSPGGPGETYAEKDKQFGSMSVPRLQPRGSAGDHKAGDRIWCRYKYPFLIIGPPHERYVVSCSIRYWPISLPYPSNDNRTPVIRAAANFLFRIQYTAAVVMRFMAKRPAGECRPLRRRSSALTIRDA
jgi:hypothetical protein